MSELPRGWTTTSLREIAILITDGDHNPPKRVAEGIPHLTARNVREGRLVLDGCTFISQEDFQRISRRYTPTAGDVIVTCVGTLGETAIVPEGLSFSADRNLAAIRPRGVILSSFLRAMLDSPRLQKDLRSGSGSTAQPHLYLGKLRELSIPLPPLSEQQQIVAAIEEQFSRLDTGVASLERASRRILPIRTAILQAAVAGTLTRIARQSGVAGLPTGWKLCSIDEITASKRNALAIGPFGSNLKVSDYTAQGIPLIFVKQVRSGIFDGPGTRFISQEKAHTLLAHRAQVGDVLITKMGEPPGDAVVYPPGSPDAIVTADVIKLSVRDGISPEYIALAINSKYVRDQFVAITSGVAQQKVSLARLRQSIRIPLPPTEEQLQITKEVSWRMQEIDRMEMSIRTQIHRAVSLRSSMLQYAASGRLASS